VTSLADVALVVRAYRFTYASEAQLQAGIAAALEKHGHAVQREFTLAGGAGRIDLLVDSAVGVEVKVAGTADAVARQVARYLESDEIPGGVVLVTAKVGHLAISHPRLEVVTLAGAGL
jgi:hypothetical protein